MCWESGAHEHRKSFWSYDQGLKNKIIRHTHIASFNGDGISNDMKVRIDKAGRIVVPKSLRERLGCKPEAEIEAIEQPDGMLLKRVKQRPSMVKVDGCGSIRVARNRE